MKKRIIAMLLAGGQGARLGVLTKYRAKPALPYGGKYKIIDFPLSNCTNSGIDTVGVLTQYQPLELNAYISTGAPWDLDSNLGGVYILPPYMKSEHGEWYTGTANAIYQNSFFIDQFNPDHLLVLSGDHIYKMDYNAMLKFHMQTEADATIAVIEVPESEVSRYGIVQTDETHRVTQFQEKPRRSQSRLASMGVYIFNWKKAKAYLKADAEDSSSSNDFGKDIIPKMIDNKEMVFAYRFPHYWMDVGTVSSMWEANMDLLEDKPGLNLHNQEWKIFSRNPNQPPHYIGDTADVKNCLVSEGCRIYGTAVHSVLFPEVIIKRGAKVRDSVVMQNTEIGHGSKVTRAIIDEGAVIGNDCRIGGEGGITVIGQNVNINDGAVIDAGMSIDPKSICRENKCEREAGI